MDLDKLGSENLKTYIEYPGMALGDELWPRFFGRGASGEVNDRDPTPITVDVLQPDGTFLLEIDNRLLIELDGGVAFYSYAKTIFPKRASAPRYVEETSTRLFFYINKPVEADKLLPVPHFMNSDGLVIDLERLPGDGQVITTHYPFMTVGDKVVLSWKDEYAFTDRFTKDIKTEDLGSPLVWRIDSSILLLAGGWCELGYTIEYAGGGRSESPVQRFTIVDGPDEQLPSLPAPQIPGHSGERLDPNQYGDGLPVEVDDYGVQYGDELLLTASGKQVSRTALRVDRSIVDSGRLRFVVPAEWLQNHVGEAVKLTWQWARAGGAADSAPLELVLRKPLDLKVSFVEGATPKDPDPEEEVDPEMVAFGFMFPDRLKLGAYALVPLESETNGGKITMHWEGFGSTGCYQTDKPIIGNNLKFQIPATAVPANFGKRVKVFYTVKDDDDAEQRSPAYGLRIEQLDSTSFEAVQCPAFPSGTISLSAVDGAVEFKLSSRSWHFFAVGQIVHVYVTGKERPGEEPLPDQVIRERLPVSEDEWFNDELKMNLGKAYLQKLELYMLFDVCVEVSFDDGANFVQGATAHLKLVP
ncbi:hypothetical protein [Pseudomonas sp. NPDC090592]|uniref:hypothetical protein n=1 Tax=Pseudomonas sp. NPDC090592 TaxID=3364480 RepID=UPI003839DF92